VIPLKLRLRNFMSYGLEGGDLDLTGIHLACLAGSNGHGKSTLIDAMTWALWGASRAPREDELPRMGTTEMEVEFEFASRGARYRVIRKRSIRKSTSIPDLQLAIWDGDTYTAITGATIAATERAIVELLGLTYETFINSSLLLQGKADLFTVKPPRERKGVLAEILELGQYEKLAARGREHERAARDEEERHRERLVDINRELERLPEIEARLREVEAEVAVEQSQRATIEATVHALDGQVRAAQSLQEQIGRHDQRLRDIETEERRFEADRTAALRRVEAARALLSEEVNLRAQVEELRLIRQEADRLGMLAGALHTLEQEMRTHTREIDRQQTGLEQEILRGDRELAELARSADQLAPKRQELTAIQRECATLPSLIERREGGLVEERTRTEAIGDLQANIKARDTQIEEQRKRLRQLRCAEAICPVCGAPLSAEGKEQAEQELIEAGKRLSREKDEWHARQVELKAELEIVRQAAVAVQNEIDRVQGLARKEGTLSQQIAVLEQQSARRAVLKEQVEQAKATLSSGQFAAEARAAARELEARIVALGYDPGIHETVRARIALLQPLEQRIPALNQARDELTRAASEAETQRTLLAERTIERERVETERAALAREVGDLAGAQARLKARHAELEAARAREAVLQQMLGSLSRQVEDATKRQAERTILVAAEAAAKERRNAMHDLAEAFGSNGIPAMLIENALPELEQDANDLLGRMTDNSTQVTFVTQRQGRTGKAIETLDIKIADSSGTRPYEMFSGGEAFRINLAIRIALSRLLARRAGAELRFLLIDEGFGTQDTQGRDRLVETIAAIADDFDKILVVTHIDELKDRFDVHIEVTKGPDGSRVAITTA